MTKNEVDWVTLLLKEVEDSLRSKTGIKKLIGEVQNIDKFKEYDVDCFTDQGIHEIITKIHEGFKPDNKANIEYDILKQLLVSQAIFYELSDNINKEIRDRYWYLTYEYMTIYTQAFNEHSNNTYIELKFKCNPFDPFINTKMKLERFCRCTELLVRFITRLSIKDITDEEKGIWPFVVFNRDIIGNEEKWLLKIREFVRSYYAYTEYKRGISRTKLIKELKLNENDKPNSLKKVNEYLKEAKRLIVSAEKGSFPY